MDRRRFCLGSKTKFIAIRLYLSIDFYAMIRYTLLLCWLCLWGGGGMLLGQPLLDPTQNRLMLKVKRNFTPEQIDSFLAERGLNERSRPFVAFVGAADVSAKSGISLGDYWEITVPNREAWIQRLQREDWVLAAEPVPSYRLLNDTIYTPNDPYWSVQWHINACNFRQAWAISKGNRNIRVGIIDSGMDYDHPDLTEQTYRNWAEINGTPGVDDDGNGYIDDLRGYNFADGNNDVSDRYYHGTQVGGAAGATTDNAVGLAGAGFNCTLMPVRVVSAGLFVVNSFAGMLYAAENGASIINLSFGRSGLFLQWEQDVITYLALEKDVVVVAASGNEKGSGPDEQNFYPASYKYVLSVTGTYSNMGRLPNYVVSPHIDVAAPGYFIETTSNRFHWPNWPYTFQTNAYAAAGTSFAAPLAAGTAVLIRAKYPELNALQVAELIRATSNDHYGVASNAPFEGRMGKGFLDAYRALNERHTARSVRIDEHYLLGGRVALNDTTQLVSLSLEVLNYLNPTQGLSITVSTTDPHITWERNQWQPGTMATLQRADNKNDPFRFQIDPRHLGRTVRFRFDFTDQNGYTDYQFLDIPLHNSALDVRLNDFALTFTNQGRIGYLDGDYFNGRGLRFRDQLCMYEGGLFVSASPSQTLDALMVNFTDRTISQDFTPDTTYFNPLLEHTHFQPDRRKLTANYTDTLTAQPIGIQIKEQVSGQAQDNTLTWSYTITNTSDSTYDSLRVGMFLDLDLGDRNTNIAGWDSIHQRGYIRSADSSRWIAIQLDTGHEETETPLRFHAFDLNDTTYSIQLYDADGFSDADKYALLDPSRQLRGETAPANLALAVGVRLDNFLPQQTRTIRFLLIGGQSSHDLDRVFANRWLGSQSSDWYTASNWSRSVPTAGDDVLILGDVPHYPLIPNGDVGLRVLEIVQGASLQINTNASLTVTALLRNNGQLQGQTASLLQKIGGLIEGNGTLTLGQFLPQDTVVLDARLTITDKLDMSQGYIRLQNSDLIIEDAATLTNTSAAHAIATEQYGRLWLRVGDAPTVFPVADARSYAPLILSAAAPSRYGLRVVGYVPADGRAATPLPDTVLSNQAIARTWVVSTADAMSHSLTLTATWQETDTLVGFDPSSANFFLADAPEQINWTQLPSEGAVGTTLTRGGITARNFAISVQNGAFVTVRVSGVDARPEDEGLPFHFVVHRTGRADKPLLVDFSMGGTAQAIQDYTVSGMGVSFDADTRQGTLVIPAGASSAVIYVTPVADNLVSPDKTLILEIEPSGR